jgi:hypothetical protein
MKKAIKRPTVTLAPMIEVTTTGSIVIRQEIRERRAGIIVIERGAVELSSRIFGFVQLYCLSSASASV